MSRLANDRSSPASPITTAPTGSLRASASAGTRSCCPAHSRSASGAASTSRALARVVRRRVGGGGGRGRDDLVRIHGEAGCLAEERGEAGPVGSREVGHHAVWDASSAELDGRLRRTRDRCALVHEHAVRIEHERADPGQGLAQVGGIGPWHRADGRLGAARNTREDRWACSKARRR